MPTPHIHRNPFRIDPTRTAPLRRLMQAEIARRFDALRDDILTFLPPAVANSQKEPVTVNGRVYPKGFGTLDYLTYDLALNILENEPRFQHLLTTNRLFIRDRLGRFAATAGHAVVSGVVPHVIAAGAKIGHVEHAAKEWAKDKIGQSVAKLPHPLQKAVTASYYAGRAGTQAAFVSWTVGQKLAERVSQEKGATPEEARRLRGVLASLDVATLKPIQLGLHATGAGSAVSGIASMVPPATASYLAYSTARNPRATYRAAKGLVRDAATSARESAASVKATLGSRVSKWFSGMWAPRKRLGINDPTPSPVGNGTVVNIGGDGPDVNAHLIADYLFSKSHPFPAELDWRHAVLVAAIEETHDGVTALVLAQRVLEGLPVPPRELIGNADCGTGSGGFKKGNHCGKGGGFSEMPPAVKSSHDKAVHELDALSKDREHALVIDSKTGEVLKRYTGEKAPDWTTGAVAEVGAPHEFTSAGRNIAHLHTHMDTHSSFSDGDWGIFASKHITHMTVIDKDHVYTLSKPDKYINAEKSKFTPRQLRERFGEISNKVEAADDGKGDIDHIVWRIVHESNRQMAEEHGFQYTYRRKDGQPVGNSTSEFDQISAHTQVAATVRDWLRYRLSSREGIVSNTLWQKYTRHGYMKGITRAYTLTAPIQVGESVDHYNGRTEQFVSNIQLSEQLTTNTAVALDQITGITGEMGAKLVKIIERGVKRGTDPKTVANQLSKQLEIGKTKAMAIARTEMVRVHAEGQLDTMAALGVDQVMANVEYHTSGQPCPKCASLSGKVFTVRNARGLIPRHPHCLCAWRPALGKRATGRSFYAGKRVVDNTEFDQISLDMTDNHLPGKHDQRTHGRLGKAATKARQRLAKHLLRESEGHTHGGRNGSDGARGAGVHPHPPGTSGQVAGHPPRPSDETAHQAGGSDRIPAGEGVAARLSEPGNKRIADNLENVNNKINKFEAFFRSKGNHDTANWLSAMREHVNSVGVERSLDAVGGTVSAGQRRTGRKKGVEYEGGWNKDVFHDDPGEYHKAAFNEAYLNRHGIILSHQTDKVDPTSPMVSSVAPKYGGTESTSRKGSKLVKDSGLASKLEESKSLPGLESSEDVSKIMGKTVTHLTHGVTEKFDQIYGKDKWIVKAYGDEAAAGYGIYFPQRSRQIKGEARDTIWNAGAAVSKYGFELHRDKDNNVIGLKHKDGEVYEFGTSKYTHTIDGDARHWGDKAAEAAQHEHGAALAGGGKEYMVQPAFPVLGLSDADRARGVTINPGQEGRVHVTTRNGQVEVIPHSTWLKETPLPVVFESADTKAMAEAARHAISKLPESERQGQIYAPDIVKTADGYRVVEVNPANHTGSSGYLGNNPLITDAYVSHMTGRTPSHVEFVRKLLTTRKTAGKPG